MQMFLEGPAVSADALQLLGSKLAEAPIYAEDVWMLQL